ncbi:hypothetical protein G7Z17_g4910 [Cylindrodendrum hubeiense]|uniref:Uncharacterized protein n=1 Tax=Cylindrodendrum hubeiense TaxID=595255 RepID=A0A9P5HE02_9HYPO|nr:hypothetical protein G7Z17_g4910 [Cylindrodendrum hubeiense]
MTDWTLQRPETIGHYAGSLSEEAKQLLSESSLTQCMSFIYNTGYGTCTEHCCKNITTKTKSLPTMFEPALNPKLSPKNVDNSTKLSQWSILDNTKLGSNRCAHDTDVESIIPLISKFWKVKCQEDAKGKYGIGIWDDNVQLPRHILARPSVEYRAYIHQRTFQLLDKTMIQQAWVVRLKRDSARRFLEEIVLFSQVPVWFSDTVFWSRPANGFDELSKLYLAWRKVWYSLVFRPNPDHVINRVLTVERKINNIIPYLHLWGDVQNDYNLYHYQELTRKDLRYTYEQEPQALRYILENLSLWKEECQILNDYVGMRRSLSRDQFHEAKRAAQRAGTAMERLLHAEEVLKGHRSNENKRTRQRLFYIAKQRFLGVQAAVFDLPIEPVSW